MKCLLIIDDDEAIRESLALALTDDGYEVCEAFDGQDALEKLAAMSPRRPSLILLDLAMPRMNGPEMLQALGPQLVNELPIVILSAQVERAARLGVRKVVSKPISLESLLNVVHEVAGQA